MKQKVTLRLIKINVNTNSKKTSPIVDSLFQFFTFSRSFDKRTELRKSDKYSPLFCDFYSEFISFNIHF